MGRGGMRLLVAGDKSHAGKSTVSLGLLIALLEAGFRPSELAYIKPATQCVSSTLIARFCEEKGIACEHIGPLVFYRGYTRQVIDGQDEPKDGEPDHHLDGDGIASELIERCSEAVEKISKGKKLTLIDGVGYPSVGSVVGCSSADIAVACNAPVLLVGKPGVGDAIDSFNLCACFFEARHVPVLGAIFNKLPPSGFYGREKCSEYLHKYMRIARPQQRVYGVLPSSEALASVAGEETCSFAYKHPEQPPRAGRLSQDDLNAVKVIEQLFQQHVDIAEILSDLSDAISQPRKWLRTDSLYLAAG